MPNFCKKLVFGTVFDVAVRAVLLAMVITVPFGPSVFFQIIFSDKDCILFLSFLRFFVLCFKYNVFLSHLYNTTVDAKPLNPPFFAKSPHISKTYVFLCWFFAFAFFFYLCIL